MSYKFQRGLAKLSGSITAEEGLDSNDAGLSSAGAIAGATTIDASGDLTVGSITNAEFTVDASGNTDIDGTLNVEGVPTFQAGAVFSSGITTAGAIAGATTISGSGTISGNALDIEADANIGGGLTVQGNLVVEGTTIQVDSTTINITGSLQFEGATNNGNETTFGVVDPTGDTTISLPALNAATDYGVAVLKGSLAAAEGVVTPAEFLVLDGNSTLNTGITVDDSADGFLMNDGGVMKHIRADNLKTYFQTGVTADTANETEGFRYADYSVTSSHNYDVASRSGIHVPSGSNSASQYSASALVNVHLSASDGPWVNGMIVTIKAPSNASDFPLTIYASGSLEKIDGDSSIVLESDNASVSLLRAFGKDWVIV